MSEEQKVYPTTQDHMAIFQEEAQGWINHFGLLGWHIEFARQKIGDRAQCRVNVDARAAGLILGEDFLGEVSEDLVRRSAFHEVCELLLARAWNTAHRSDLAPEQRRDAMVEAQHEVIRILENVVWAPGWAARQDAEYKNW